MLPMIAPKAMNPTTQPMAVPRCKRMASASVLCSRSLLAGPSFAGNSASPRSRRSSSILATTSRAAATSTNSISTAQLSWP
jgi:hypothetical protein